MRSAKNLFFICVISIFSILFTADDLGLKNHKLAEYNISGENYLCVECNAPLLEKFNARATLSGKIPANFPDLQGTIIQSGKTKLVIVEFFHPLCSPCRDSVKHLNEIDKRDDVEVIAVSVSSEESLKKFISELCPEYQIWKVSKDFFKEMEIEYVPHAFIYRTFDKQILWNDHPSKITDDLLDELEQK